MTDIPNLDPMAQQPGESRSAWKERTFAHHYGMGARKLYERAQEAEKVLTLLLVDNLLCHSSLTHTPIYYVGYDKPSREDRQWALDVTPVILPVPKSGPITPLPDPTHYSMVWTHINDDQAQEDYPIFNALASEYNWKPLRQAIKGECPHTRVISEELGIVRGNPVIVNECQDCGKKFRQRTTPE